MQEKIPYAKGRVFFLDISFYRTLIWACSWWLRSGVDEALVASLSAPPTEI